MSSTVMLSSAPDVVKGPTWPEEDEEEAVKRAIKESEIFVS